jgi:hypothetical protein
VAARFGSKGFRAPSGREWRFRFLASDQIATVDTVIPIRRRIPAPVRTGFGAEVFRVLLSGGKSRLGFMAIAHSTVQFYPVSGYNLYFIQDIYVNFRH